MNVHNLGETNSVLHQFIAEIRDKDVQKDRLRFRKNIERIGSILGYEMSKDLSYRSKNVHTPFGTKEVSVPNDRLVLCSVLRAGIPLHYGLLNLFDGAENAFISAYRHHPGNGPEFEVIVRYFAAPDLNGKVLVLTDPMLATGKTLENVYRTLSSHGAPKKIHLVSVIGSQSGVDYVSAVFPESTNLWIAAIDHKLAAQGYIVPGIGDAGDLAFGEKL
jgi:uracil phosphoribosyltransferase